VARPKRLAIAASAAYPDLRDDWPLLRNALKAEGVFARTEVWSDPSSPWHTYDLVLAEGAWDNIQRPDEFLAWADRVAADVTLANSPATLRWNIDKRYLSVLADAGVPIVPTTWVDPTDPQAPLPEGEFVVKPTISGGGYQTARYGDNEHDAARAHLAALAAVGRTAMIQPYQSKVDELSEMGLIFLGSQYSHAISKGALLQSGAGVQSELFRNERIGVAEPTDAYLGVAWAALRVAEDLFGPTTYARVDLIPRADSSPAVLELELLDPALFMETAPDAAARFAKVLSEQIRRG
jgi:glutathione synthase/RimK-type ligase-like ATP-grasp enzyme